MNTFDPVKYSLEENQFLYEHVGQPPVVALQAIPEKVNSRAVKPVLERVYELIELEKHSGREWGGLDKVKQAIKAYLTEAARWKGVKERFPKAPRFPSMYSFDARKRAHWSGPGSDSGKVSTYFDSEGKRVKFEINLVEDEQEQWQPEWISNPKEAETPQLVVDETNNRIECSVCGHTESFNPESRASFNAARARISKHLRKATNQVDAHRELHTLEFGN